MTRNAPTAADLTITAHATGTAPAYAHTEYNGGQVTGERNDCAVRALMTVTGSTYGDAHSHLATLRSYRKGTSTLGLIRMLDRGDTILGSKFTRVQGKAGQYQRSNRTTLNTFCKAHPVGRYYLLKRGHAIAVVDGVVVDTWRPGGRSLVTGAWQVTSATTHHPAQLRALLLSGMTWADAATATGVSRSAALAAQAALRAAGLLA
jgi:hypothetical protein